MERQDHRRVDVSLCRQNRRGASVPRFFDGYRFLLSAAAAGSGPLQPILCLLVSPTRDREAFGCGHTMAGGTDTCWCVRSALTINQIGGMIEATRPQAGGPNQV